MLKDVSLQSNIAMLVEGFTLLAKHSRPDTPPRSSRIITRNDTVESAALEPGQHFVRRDLNIGTTLSQIAILPTSHFHLT